MKSDFFQAVHSPAGAEAGFALGYLYHGGGFAVEQDNIPEQDVYIGVRRKEGTRFLPFFRNSGSDGAEAFTQEEGKSAGIPCYAPDEIRRNFRYGTDTFETADFKFELFSPVRELPDPACAPMERCRAAFCPAILARFTIDNAKATEPAEGLFAVSPMKAKFPLSRASGGTLKGFRSEEHYGFAVKGGEQAVEFCDFGINRSFQTQGGCPFLIAPLAGLSFQVPAGETRTIELALGWHHEGIVTGGTHRCSYWYCRYFPSLEEVLAYTLRHTENWEAPARENDRVLENSGLSRQRQFLIAQSAKTYYLSSMLFDDGGSPRWVMDEGTFRMMNTFDLTVDHAFFELRNHPWAVRSQLDAYLEEYSYYDQCGLTFTHDQGTHHVFSPEGYSSYERPGLTGCFSYMSQEQLCNWILTAALYLSGTEDTAWAGKRLGVFSECLSSMLARDSQTGGYDGIMKIDSARCEGGREITTYDSLDQSLGQAGNNLYMAVKCWAAYVALETVFSRLGKTAQAEESAAHAALCAQTVCRNFREDLGYIPAVFEGENRSAIIPAIEGLLYPERLGRMDALNENGAYGEMIRLLKRHLETVLRPGICLFPDGGWKLSSTSDNSWISKIFLCEYVAEEILGIRHDYDKADSAHESWWKNGCPSNPGIDQILAGTQPSRNFHYPRCVTSDLWMQKKRGG